MNRLGEIGSGNCTELFSAYTTIKKSTRDRGTCACSTRGIFSSSKFKVFNVLSVARNCSIVPQQDKGVEWNALVSSTVTKAIKYTGYPRDHHLD